MYAPTYLQRDLLNIGYDIPQATLQNLLRMLTQINGNVLNMSDLSRSLGGSWESYVIEQIKRSLPDTWQFFYYRTHVGAEIDLLLISPNGQKIGIEIKFSNAPSVSRGFYECVKDLSLERCYIITPSSEKYPKNENTTVISLLEFLECELVKF